MTSPSFLQQHKINKEKPVEKPEKFLPEIQKSNDFQEKPFLSQYQVKPKNQIEDKARENRRQLLGLGARTAEAAIGIPQETKKGFGNLLDLFLKGTEYISNKKFPELRKLIQDPLSVYKPEQIELMKRFEKEHGTHEISPLTELPTSEDIKEKITKPASKYFSGDENVLEPKSEIERASQEGIQDFTRLALGGGGLSLMAKAGLAVAGQTGKETAKLLGFDPSKQELAKMGVLVILSLAKMGNAPQHASNYFENTVNQMPKGVSFNAKPVIQELNNIKNQSWHRVGNVPSTRAAKQLIQDIENSINQNGYINARDAIQLRKQVNEIANNLGAFDVASAQKSAHIGHVNQVRDALVKGMEQSLGKAYPNWWKQYQDANAVYGITQKSGALSNWIANNYTKPLISDTGKILFANALSKGAAGVIKGGALAATVATQMKTMQILNRYAKSPTLRKYYNKVLLDASRQDSLALSKSLERFDKAAQKEEQKNKPPYKL